MYVKLSSALLTQTWPDSQSGIKGQVLKVLKLGQVILLIGSSDQELRYLFLAKVRLFSIAYRAL